MPSAAPYRFTFILDGLGDPIVARDLTRAVHETLSVIARADPAGMWLEIEAGQPIDEAMSDRVAAITRRFALEPRDRIGSSFVSSVTAEQLRQRMAYEWTSRWATGLIFLLPAMALHYLTPILAQGSRLIPGMIEGTLVIWALIAAAWPIAWQGLLALRARRMTPDLFTLVGLAVSLVAGLAAVVVARENTLHITSMILMATTTQRMIISRRAGRLEGCAHLMPPSRWLLGLVLIGAMVLIWFDFAGAMAMLLAMPALISLLSINRLAHPLGAMIPPLLMCGLLAMAPAVFPEDYLAGRVEAAFAFNVLLTLIYGAALGGHRLDTRLESL